jgi:hypothetical protein
MLQSTRLLPEYILEMVNVAKHIVAPEYTIDFLNVAKHIQIVFDQIAAPVPEIMDTTS